MKKSFNVRMRLFGAFFLSILAISLAGLITWGGFRKAQEEIRAFQDENIPQLKNSLRLSELGTSLESLSLLIPSSASREEIGLHRQQLGTEIGEMEKQLGVLSKIQERSSGQNASQEEEKDILTHMLRLGEIRSDLEAGLLSLLETTETMIVLEDKRKALSDTVAAYKSRTRTKFRKRMDDSNTRLQIHIQNVRDAGSDGKRLEALVAHIYRLQNEMDVLANAEKISGYLSLAASSRHLGIIENMSSVFNSDLPSFVGKINRLGNTHADREIKKEMKAIAKAGVGRDSIFGIRKRQIDTSERSDILIRETKNRIREMKDRINEIVEHIEMESHQRSKKTLKETNRVVFYVVLLIVFMAATMALVAFLTIRSISRPLGRISLVLRNVADGDLTAEVGIERRDEIGDMAADLNHAIGNLRIMMRTLTDSTEELYDASGKMRKISRQMDSSAEKTSTRCENLTKTSEQVAGNVETVASAVEQASLSLSRIAQMTEDISSVFVKMVEFARRTSGNVKAMAASSDDISLGIGTAAAAVEEMSVSLNEVAKNTSQAKDVSRNASRRAGEIDAKMEALSAASKQIGKFLEVIKDIADQTNMLALNATIEAAGAGEAGRGFAVVAGEIKELAKQSADAAGDIAEQIGQIRSSTDDAVLAVGDIRETIREIADINESIAASVEEQTATANEISKSVTGNASAVKTVAENANESSRLVAEIAKSTDEMSARVSEAGRHMEELAEGIKEVAASSGNAATGVQEISESIREISEASRETAMGASQSSDSSRKLARIAAELADILKRFKL